MSDPSHDLATNSLSTEEGSPPQALAETEQSFPDYGQAAKAACSWVTTGKTNGTPEAWNNQFLLYYSRLGTYKDKVVGLAVQRSTAAENVIRIDRDPTKGIHWNAKMKTDSEKKLAAKITGTTGDTTTVKKRMDRYVEGLQGKTAKEIWEAWSKGNAPSGGTSLDEEEFANDDNEE